MGQHSADETPHSGSPIIETPDGSATAYNTRFGQAYGSRHGAKGQAEHVFLQGTQTDIHPAPMVLEVGFGVGVNFLTTLHDIGERNASLHYLAYEFDPAPLSVLQQVGVSHGGEQQPIWQDLLAAWPELCLGHTLHLQNGKVQLELRVMDVLTAQLPTNWASAIYLDGFSPSKNPEVWTAEFAQQLAQALQVGGYLATYSAAGHVRRALQSAGLTVNKRPGAAGKRECVQAQRLS